MRPESEKSLADRAGLPYDFSMPVCHSCQKPAAVEGKIKRSDVCPGCRNDLRCCKNCKFYDRSAHNQCREPAAEWTANKEKANFCDYFVFADRASTGAGNSPETARKKFDDLFKKDG
jgi:hypothetical protein